MSVSIEQARKVAGDEAVQKLADAFPGDRLYFPKKGINFPDQQAKEQYIQNKFFSAGWSVERIAYDVGLSVSHIRKIICKR